MSDGQVISLKESPAFRLSGLKTYEATECFSFLCKLHIGPMNVLICKRGDLHHRVKLG